MPIWAITSGIISIATAIGLVAVSWAVESVEEITDKPAGNALLWGGALFIASLGFLNFKKG